MSYFNIFNGYIRTLGYGYMRLLIEQSAHQIYIRNQYRAARFNDVLAIVAFDWMLIFVLVRNNCLAGRFVRDVIQR